MYIENSEKYEQRIELRKKILQAEQERIEGAETLSISEARKRLYIRAVDNGKKR